MAVSLPLPVEIVNQSSQLGVAVKAMLVSRGIALDTESNSLHRYPEQLCLIQIATCHRVYLIDTIVLKEIAFLKEVLADASIIKVVHGADYDIRSLDRHHGFHIRNLYDTNIAASFAGLTRVGLAAVIEDMLGVTIPKSERLQRADWGQRPLSTEALDYAAADVRYLLALKEALGQRLQALGRTEWVAEECARLAEVRYAAPSPETAFLSFKGARDLDGRGLAILRSLFLFREEEARRQRRPPFFVIPNSALLSLATSPTTALSKVPGLGQTGLKRFGRGLQQAIHDGLAAPPIRRPPPVAAERFSHEQFERLTRLKAWRASLGSTLSLDPPLLWPTASLERLARAPDTLGVELTSADIRRWQHDRFASTLRAYLESLL
ncbi:MAG: HRDC domain-containing protein [Dehalococcoidales bacterium]|nr:HRDC domain-containing protein [Dehalococcoidales bacterium]